MGIRSVLNSSANVGRTNENTDLLQGASTPSLAENGVESDSLKRGELKAYGDYYRNGVESLWMQQQQQPPEPTPEELQAFPSMDAGINRRPPIPTDALADVDPKAAAERYLREVTDKYYFYYKDITDQAGTPTPQNPNPPRKTAAEIAALQKEKTERLTYLRQEFQKRFDKAYKEIVKGARKAQPPLSEEQLRARATVRAVQGWNEGILYGDKNKAKADKNLALFVAGKGDTRDIALNDINQGQVGDCYIVAAIGTLAQQQPETIQQAITDNGDGTYNVRLYLPDIAGNYVAREVVVDAKLSGEGHAKYGDTGKVGKQDVKEIWPVLVEKAVTKALGSYERAGKGGDPHNVLTMLTGKAALTSKAGDYQPQDLARMLGEGQPLVLSTPKKRDALSDKLREKFDKYGLVQNHAYVLQEVKKTNKGEFAVLYNPWGDQHAEVPLSELRDLLPYLTAQR
jgi:hypothetical protein